jgi:phage FluMu protein Com
MPTRFPCPSCNVILKLTIPVAAGKKIKCPKCAAVVTVPADEEAPAAPPGPAAPLRKPVAPPRAEAPRPTAGSPKPPEAARKPAVARAQDSPDDGHDQTWEEKPPTRKGVERVTPMMRAKRSSPLGIILLIGLLILLAGGGLAGYFLYVSGYFDSKPPTSQRPPGPGPGTPLPPVAKNDLDVSYVLPEFSAAVIVHPKRISQAPLLAPAMKPEVLGGATKEMGFDPRQVERAIVLIQPMPGGNEPFFPAVVIRFDEPVDGTKVIGTVLKGSIPAQHEGRSYFRTKDDEITGMPAAGAVLDEQTILLAPEPLLQRMLTLGGNAPGPLAAPLRQADLDADVIAVVNIEQLKPLLAVELERAKNDPAFAPFANVLDHLKTATVSANLSGDTLLRVDLEGYNDASAAELETMLNTALENMRTFYAGFRKETQAQGLPPPFNTLTQPLLALLDELTTGVSVSREGTHTVASWKMPEKQLAELSAKLAPLIDQLIIGSREKPKPKPPTKP